MSRREGPGSSDRQGLGESHEIPVNRRIFFVSQGNILGSFYLKWKSKKEKKKYYFLNLQCKGLVLQNADFSLQSTRVGAIIIIK